MDFLKDNSTEESRETRRLLDKALEKSANEALKSKKENDTQSDIALKVAEKNS